MKNVQGIETLVTVVHFVTDEKGSLTPEQLRTKIEAMLASGNLWIGSLDATRDRFGHFVQGRQISRRAIVANWTGFLAQVISLLGEEFEEDTTEEVNGWETNGLLVRPFVADGNAPDETQPIVVDCVNRGEGLFLVYHPTKVDHDRGLCGSRGYTMRNGQLGYAE